MKVLYFNANARTDFNGSYTVPDFILNTIANKSPDIVILTEVIPIFRESDSYKFHKDNYTIHHSPYKQKEKNAVLIAVNKDFKIIDFDNAVPGFSDKDKSPDYLNIHVKTNKTIYNIIGFRMLTVGYDERSKLFDIFYNNAVFNVDNETTIFIGDFNNAKHYGRLNKSFKDVEELYWRQEWDDLKNAIVVQRNIVYNITITFTKLKTYF